MDYSNRFIGKLTVLLASIIMLLIIETQASERKGPFNYLFGNHIDSHQISKLVGNGDLRGKLMITFTGDYNSSGIPVAKHCSSDTEEKDCVVGWKFLGRPGKATFLYHHQDHPVWLVENRSDLPQPGAFTHFHWVSNTDMNTHDSTHTIGCNAQSAEQLTVGLECTGYFLRLVAIKHFVFKHHMDIIPVSVGVDTATHTNIVTSVAHTHGNGSEHDH